MLTVMLSDMIFPGFVCDDPYLIVRVMCEVTTVDKCCRPSGQSERAAILGFDRTAE